MERLLVPAAAKPAVAAAHALPRRRGRPPKTADERDDGNRRLELLSAAARLFHRKGFDATSTRDIAAAVGMRSGSPFYHFASKRDLLHAVMAQGMRSAIAQQAQVLARVQGEPAQGQLRALIRSHFDVLLGPRSDFIPVMLYEIRSISPAQRRALAALRSDYESAWEPVLQALHEEGRLRADVPVARLLIFGALNWSVQWYSTRRVAAQRRLSLDELTAQAMALFVAPDTKTEA